MKTLFILLSALLLTLSACSGTTPEPVSSTAPAPEESFLPVVEDEPSSSALPKPELRPEPDNSWQFDIPENHGMDQEVFAQLHKALAGSTVYAMVTVKDGVIIDEYYQEGYNETDTFALHSCSKSFLSALIGIAIEQQLIGSVDDRLSDYLPQAATLTDGKQNLTLRHLLTHTSGLEWYEWGGSYSNWDEFQSSPNWVEYILGQDLVAQPGSIFNYSTGNSHLLAAALEQAAGISVLDYAKESLFEPLGMESVQWSTDPQGITDGGNGISMTAQDAARFGQLYLQGGVWHDRQLIPAQWIRESTTAQNNGAGDGTGSYGYQWWIRSFGPESYRTYYAFGAWGQYILIVPDLNLVTVIANRGPQDSYASRAYFTDYVLKAIQK